jgi:ribonuclease BN (tRNA processing enzyme)
VLEVTVLGATGSFLDPATNAPCSGFLVRSGDSTLLLDCGYGVLVNAHKYLDLACLDGVFLSHIHPDHCADVFNLNGYLRRHPADRTIEVLCPGEARPLLSSFVEAWSSSLTWTDITEGADYQVGNLYLKCSRTRHGPPTYACEVRYGGGSIVYTADTGPNWSPDAFVPEPDLLICDAAYLDPEEGPPVHLTAAQAGLLARRYGARMLLLTHLRSGADLERIERDARAEFSGQVAIAVPHLQLTIDT